MNRYVPSGELLVRLRAGERSAVSRLISRAELSIAEARPVLAEIYRCAGSAHVIGITGVPGSGKSTLVTKLVQALRPETRIGVIAVDPSSPYSGGAILGDRVRMSELGGDDGIFIRSMATRGSTGGMARAALEAADILDVAGFGTIIIETVGVGQDEVEIASASHTTVVVSAPGLGDDIQAIKAGILEIADIHVVSKADRSDANRTITDLKTMLALGAHSAPQRAWQTPVIGTSAISGEGIAELAAAIRKHRATDNMERSAAIARFRLGKTAETLLLEELDRCDPQGIARLAMDLAGRKSDPYSAARQMVDDIFRREN